MSVDSLLKKQFAARKNLAAADEALELHKTINRFFLEVRNPQAKLEMTFKVPMATPIQLDQFLSEQEKLQVIEILKAAAKRRQEELER